MNNENLEVKYPPKNVPSPEIAVHFNRLRPMEDECAVAPVHFKRETFPNKDFSPVYVRHKDRIFSANPIMKRLSVLSSNMSMLPRFQA
jgi:hypothetical protein